MIKGGFMTVKNMSKSCQKVLDKYEDTGVDFDCFMGKIARGESASLTDVLYYAQCFSHEDYRGALVSSTAFERGYKSLPRLSSVDGLFYDQFTSYILIDKSEGLGDLRETYTNSKYRPFFSNDISTDFSNIDNKLKSVADGIDIETKKFGIKRTKKLQLSEIQTSNNVCSIVDKIYQIAYAQLGSEFSTNLEKVTAAIFATYVTTKALNFERAGLSNCEARLNEALKLNFITHLNGCYDNKSVAISKIIKDGAEVGMKLIEDLGLGVKDVQDKNERLGLNVASAKNSLFDSLFGEKKVEKVAESVPVKETDIEEEKGIEVVVPDPEEIKREDQHMKVEKKDLQNEIKNAIGNAIWKTYLSPSIGKGYSEEEWFWDGVYHCCPDSSYIINKEEYKLGRQIGLRMSEYIDTRVDDLYFKADDGKERHYEVIAGNGDEAMERLKEVFAKNQRTESFDAWVDGMLDSLKKQFEEYRASKTRDDENSETLNRLTPEEIVTAMIATTPLMITDGTRTETVKPDEEVAKRDRVADKDEKIVSGDAVVGDSDDVVHKKGNAVNYRTLKNNLLTNITDKLDEKANFAAIRAEKNKDFDALTESNFWAGASEGFEGGAKQPKGKTDAYYAGYTHGHKLGCGLVWGIDRLYSPDKKTLMVDVEGKGKQVTKQLGDKIVPAFGCKTFAEFVENVISSLSKTFETFKNKTKETTKQ